MNKLLSEKAALLLMTAGFFLFLVAPGFFVYKEKLNLNNQINSEKFGHLGDFLSGTAGALWALASVILFYIAMVYEKNRFNSNEENQRKEKFEMRLFALIESHHSLIETIHFEYQNYYEKRMAIDWIANTLRQGKRSFKDIEPNIEFIFSNLLTIFEQINNEILIPSDRLKFANILMRQLSHSEIYIMNEYVLKYSKKDYREKLFGFLEELGYIDKTYQTLVIPS